MRPTRARELVAAAVVVGVLAYVLLAFTYRDLPRFPRTAPLSLLIVGLAEAQTAAITRRRLQGRPGTRPILPLTVARLAALAKASSLAGAALMGAWAALLGYALPRLDEFGTADTDAVTAGLGVAAALVLLVSGLLLERVCRVPKP
ncbi:MULTISPECIES: DUF3180 domain-containing protein [Protofrankia]|uniref:DUF3180 domain-containing protein n=1 Tax=Protofrankia coriariae TaxID=1562887 RepID=A0ABR5F1A6_9ACTN|nr:MULTISPECIES: DUF3180 domain-containing protein [Protofrankia]KLL10499.1 hypothetical protein FrCorBMG51_17665 [Protofrankia coriariae]ONH34098.1 hypothetical protein BL254_18100 [Protofrankia sp. BMG5.30]